jgi:hypothetical protein
MPNIVITEGLDTPWELKDTESNITAATDLTSINLANQTVGTLAYTASQLFASLKTEKSNLDNIVDAIELINEEIALWPERIAKWDTVSSELDKVDMSVIPIRDPLYGISIAIANDITDTDLSKATVNPQKFDGTLLTQAEQERNRKIIDSVATLISAKPSLESQNYSNSRIGAAILLPPEFSPIDKASWFILEPKLVEGTTPGTGGSRSDLVVYRDQSGQPISYEYIGNARATLTPEQVKFFFIPKDAAERDLMQDAINSQTLIEATNSLINATGLPSGVTPPVTTLGASVEKYYDKARYEMTEYTTNGLSTPIGTPNPYVTMSGDYPPIQEPNFGSRIITTSDVGKFFQNAGGTIFYVDRQGPGTQFVVREALSTTPFIANMTDDLKKTLRGEYAEKQILLTQRSTDQTLFVTSITQRYTTFSDMATNLLKTLVNFYNDLARNLRG